MTRKIEQEILEKKIEKKKKLKNQTFTYQTTLTEIIFSEDMHIQGVKRK